MQITLNLLTANRVVNTHDKELVFFNHLKNVLQSHLPTLSSWFCLKNSIGILNKRPLHQIINILEMVVKSHPTNPTLICQVLNCNLAQGLLKKQTLQRLLQSPFGYLCHLRPLLSLSLPLYQKNKPNQMVRLMFTF